MLAIAAGAFAFKTWILYAWPRSNGVVVSSSVKTSQSDDGATLCSAVESVHYLVGGKDLFVENGGHIFTSDCASVRAAVAVAPGQSRIVIYNKLAPGATYVDPGFTIGFYLVAFVLICLAGGFAFAGWVGSKVFRWMVRRGIDLP
jgi:hypothetical protein